MTIVPQLNFTRLALLMLPALLLGAAPSFAEEEGDEQFSAAVSDFGYAAGAAWQCAEGAARKDIEHKAMNAYNGLIRLFGSDEAFFFASAFGGGTSAGIDKSKCGEFAEHFKEGLGKAGVQ